jgi:hypothetical protein
MLRYSTALAWASSQNGKHAARDGNGRWSATTRPLVPTTRRGSPRPLGCIYSVALSTNSYTLHTKRVRCGSVFTTVARSHSRSCVNPACSTRPGGTGRKRPAAHRLAARSPVLGWAQGSRQYAK